MKTLLILVFLVHEINCIKTTGSKRTAVLEEGSPPLTTCTCDTQEGNQNTMA